MLTNPPTHIHHQHREDNEEKLLRRRDVNAVIKWLRHAAATATTSATRHPTAADLRSG